MMKNKKIIIIGFILLIISLIAVPSFCKVLFNTEHNNYEIANSFESGDGSKENPYIIKTAPQFKYFKSLLAAGDTFEGKYLEVSDDIFINEGLFDYNKNKNELYYIKNSIKYNINMEINNYSFYSGTEEKGTLNNFNNINSGTFKGNLDGNNHFIYGLYLNNYLFEEISGTVKNINLSNYVIISNENASVFKNVTNSNISNVILNGTVISLNDLNTVSGTIEDFSLENDTREIKVSDYISNYTEISNIKITGKYNSLNQVQINDAFFYDGTIEYESNLENITITTFGNTDFYDLNYEIKYYNSSASVISKADNSHLENVVLKGELKANTTASFIMDAVNNVNIKNSYSEVNQRSTNISSSFLHNIVDSNISIRNVYYNGNIYSDNIGNYFFNNIVNSTYEIYNSFSIPNIEAMNIYNNMFLDMLQGGNYFYSCGTNICSNGGTIYDKNTFIKEDNFKNNLDYKVFDENNISNNNVWKYKDNLPKLYIDDVLDPTIKIKVMDYEWNSLTDNLNLVRINDKSEINIMYEDNNDIAKVEYYLSSKKVDNIYDSNIEWNIYNDLIKIEDYGSYVLYVKVTDVYNNISYANTDLIVFDYFQHTISKGYDFDKIINNNVILDNIPINFEFKRNTYYDENPYINSKYYLETNVQLLNGTVITLSDKNKMYYCIVNNDSIQNIDGNYYYDLSSFKEINTKVNFDNNPVNYRNDNYFNEDFIISIKFNNISENLQINCNLVLMENSIIVRSNNDKEVTISSAEENGAKLEISTDFNESLYFSNGESYNIPINTSINYGKVNDNLVNDDSVNDRILYNIYMTKDGNKIDDLYKYNINFNLGNNLYYSDLDGIVRIESDANEEEIIINVKDSFNNFLSGEYKLVISKVGYFYNLLSNKIEIPITFNDKLSLQNSSSFKLFIDNNDRIYNKISKKTINNNDKIPMTIYYKGNLKSPNFTISLYKKDFNTNDYNKVDFSIFFNNTLNVYRSKEYYLDNNVISNKEYYYYLEPNSFNISNGLYKIVVSLNDDAKAIRSVEKTVLVK